jgi:hypothetical protein
MSTALSTYEVEEARMLAVLTDADKALITKEVRKRAFSFDTEADTTHKIRCEISRVAREMDRTDLVDWSSTALESLTGNTYSTRGVSTLADFVAKVEASLVEREAEADAEYPVDAALHADVRKWIAVTPFTVFRFRTFVVEAAVDAARDSALEMLSRGCPEDSSVPRAVEAASKKWLAAWEKKGEIL